MKPKNIEDLYYFCNIVSAGSLHKAAQRLNIPAPTLSRRLKNLEISLEKKLLNRNAHSMALTTEGELYYNKLLPSFKKLEQEIEVLNNDEGVLEGEIVIAVPVGMLKICMNSWLVEFLKKWPKVTVTMRPARSLLDFEKNKIDIAIKIEPIGPSDWTMVKIMSSEKWLVASEGYLSDNSTPTKPEQLNDHTIIMNLDNSQWHFMQDGKITGHTFKPRFQPPNIFDAIDATIWGLGISYNPRFMVEEYVNKNELVRLMENYTVGESAVYILHVKKPLLSKRVHALVEFLQKKASLLNSMGATN